MKSPEKIYLSNDKVMQHTRKLISKIDKLGLDMEKTAIIAIVRGGLLPAQYLSYAFGIRDIFAVGSSIYDGENKVRGQEVSNVLCIDFETFDNFLVVDDIYDTGDTMNGVIKTLNEVSLMFKEVNNFIPVVMHSHKKVVVEGTDLIYGKKFKKINGQSPWIVYPWDDLGE